MGREAMIRADMEAVGTYNVIFEPTIKQLAKAERELAKAEKTWRSNGGQMVAELTNKTGGKYTAKDPHYAVVDQLRKDILALRNQLGLTPNSLHVGPNHGFSSHSYLPVFLGRGAGTNLYGVSVAA